MLGKCVIFLEKNVSCRWFASTLQITVLYFLAAEYLVVDECLAFFSTRCGRIGEKFGSRGDLGRLYEFLKVLKGVTSILFGWMVLLKIYICGEGESGQF